MSDLAPRGGLGIVARRTARRASRSAAAWGVVFGTLVANEALSWSTSFPDQVTRTRFAASMGDNRGLQAVTGPARQLDTLAGFVSWRLVALMMVAGAVWGLLTATRLLRGEEDAGRWDLYLCGRTSRRRATAEGLWGLGLAWLLLWAITAAATVAAGLSPRVGFSVGASLLYATTGTAGAAVFLAVGAVTSQLAGNRRQANAMGGVVLGVAWGLRMLADGGVLPTWLRWATPLGWVENITALTDPHPAVVLALATLVGGCGWYAVVLAGRRDVGEGLWVRETPRAPRTALLTGAGGLAVRLERWTAVSWVGSLALVGLVFGLVARAAAGGGLGNVDLGDVTARSAASSQAAMWVGFEFLYLASILSVAAAAQVSAMRAEEAEGHLDHLLGRRVSRRAWLGQRLGLAATVVLATGLATGIGGWVGVGGRGGVGLPDMLRAGLNTAVPGLVVLGLGALLFGLVPRWASAVLYAYVVWTFVVEIFGGSVLHVRWLARTSVLDHLGAVPAADLDWPVIGGLLLASLAAAAVGLLAFERRDVLLG